MKRSYRQLRPQYVIFICTFDPFGKGRYVYTFTNRCHEVAGLELDDGMTTIFLNAKRSGEISPELKSLLDYVAGEKPTADDPFITRIDELVAEAKQKAEWRREYMTLNMEFALKYDEGVDAGIVLGRREGRQEGRQEAQRSIMERLIAGGMDPAEAARYTDPS